MILFCEESLSESDLNEPSSEARLTARVHASSDRGRTAVGPKSDGTRRVSTWTPRLAGLNGADSRLVGIGWRWRWRHYIDCPAHAAPRGSPKISSSLLFPSAGSPTLQPVAPLAWVKTTCRICRRENDFSTNLSSFAILLIKRCFSNWEWRL